MSPGQSPGPDYARVFDVAPTPLLLLTPQLTVVRANKAMIEATGTVLVGSTGQPLLHVLRSEPGNAQAEGLRRLRESLERAGDTGRPDIVPLQRYVVSTTDGGERERFWSHCTVPVLGEPDGGVRALTPVEIVPKAGRFFDYEEKYSAGGATEHCPPKSLDDATCAILRELGERAHEAAGCEGYSRVDFIVPQLEDGRQGPPVALEINTLPGMTSRSLLPMSAAHAGLSFRALCLRLLELALQRTELAPTSTERASTSTETAR